LFHDTLQVSVFCRARRRRVRFRLQLGQAFFGAAHPRLEFFALHVAVLIGIEQARDAAPHLGEQALQLLHGPARFLPATLQAALVLLVHALWIRQQGADVLPHQLVQQVRATLLVATDPRTTKAIRVTSDTSIVRIVTWLALAGRPAQWLAVVGVATLTTDQQSLQQIALAALALPPPLAILRQLFRHGCEESLVHDRRHPDANLFLSGRVVHGHRPPRLRRLAALRT
jgi:hypothetical protein